MRTLAAIRTHRWTEAEDRLLAQLRAAFGDDVCVVFHDRGPDATPPCEVVDLTADWVKAQGLRVTRDWGWRCGDYFLYALRAAKPGYDHYWLVEPDVFFSGDSVAFFEQFTHIDTDLLGLDPAPIDKDHRFTTSMPEMAHWGAIFAMTRISGRAIDWLKPLRVVNGTIVVGQLRFANDEAFIYSHAMADDDITVGNLRDHAPDWFEGAQFATAPDVLIDVVQARPELLNKVMHPVHCKQTLKGEIAKRASDRQGFLGNIGESWDHMNAADLEDIADTIRERSLRALRQARRSWRKKQRRADVERAAE